MTYTTEVEAKAMTKGELVRALLHAEAQLKYQHEVNARNTSVQSDEGTLIAFATRLLGCHMSNKARELTVAFLVNHRGERKSLFIGGEA